MSHDIEGMSTGQLKRRWAPSLLASAALFTLLILVAVSCGGTVGEQRAEESAKGASQAGAEKPQSGTDEEQVGAALENPSLGSENAPVVMIEYADYQ